MQTGHNSENTENGVAARLKALALSAEANGNCRLRLAERTLKGIKRATETAYSMEEKLGLDQGAMQRLFTDMRSMENCAMRARADEGARLPAVNGVARVLLIMRELVSDGSIRIDAEALRSAITHFDSLRPISMRELWQVPTALRIALSECYLRTAESVLSAARQRQNAERWINGDKASDKDAHFYEHALKLSLERELPEARSRIENELRLMDESLERCIRRAHEADARDRLCLDNLTSAYVMLEAIDWQKCFAELSPTEHELLLDPSGIYPSMDESSKEAVRRELEALAVRLNMGETNIAHAARVAAEGFIQSELKSNICWWLYTDDGRRALAKALGVPNASMKRMTPDPDGRQLCVATLVCTVVLSLLFVSITNRTWSLIFAIPLTWGLTQMLFAKFSPLIFKPKKLLKLKLPTIPCKLQTMVVIPALISSVKRAKELIEEIETLGCLHFDENLSFLVLGDFKDSISETDDEDEGILDVMRDGISRLNEAAGREKYFYLQRSRTYYAKDRRWMGYERKRGAIMELNRLLLNLQGAENAFLAENSRASALTRGFRYVITLDSGTRLMPETINKLIGCIAHPINALYHGYVILQPDMQLSATSVKNAFQRAFAGNGGADSYAVCVSNLYMDVTGKGIYAGKGIYDVRAFHEALSGALPEGKILSHDAIEGMLSKTGYVCDISLFDAFPASFEGYIKRLHRWTRGDWQLLPFIFTKSRKRLTADDRLKLIDNLMRSMFYPSLLWAFIYSIWTFSGECFALAVLFAFMEPLLSRFKGTRSAIIKLAALPAIAGSMLDAIIRTLWRLCSGCHNLLDWTASADEGAGEANAKLYCRISAILLLPGLISLRWVWASLALIALFLIAPNWLNDLYGERMDASTRLTSRQIDALFKLAQNTWRFFAVNVAQAEHGLPPDNIQIEPVKKCARRTSPTNIGMYILSCLSAMRLGMLDKKQTLTRIDETITTLEALEKWKGHIYNWYDIDTLMPLNPRYVSSVDSGNLAASLLLASSALSTLDTALAGRMEKLARDMDFNALYDENRGLFAIGLDVSNGRLSESRYDLLASESRILTYVAIMLGQISRRGWDKLSRPAVRIDAETTLISWSGTMFEYLMPEIFMRTHANTLLHQSNIGAVSAQMAYAEESCIPWGVSESGYYAFDMGLNYQYKAFGIRELSLSGAYEHTVVAPYASLLALPVDAALVAENVMRMNELGWSGEYGLYEAADYSAGVEPRIVKSYMSHHQGMILAAITNSLTDDSLSADFMSIPQARAISLLLEEKPATRIRLSRSRELHKPQTRADLPEERFTRRAQASDIDDAMLLYGANARAQAFASGGVYYRKGDIYANSVTGAYASRREGIFTFVCDSGVWLNINARAIFDAGAMQRRYMSEDLEVIAETAISPEHGTLITRVKAKNNSPIDKELEVVNAFAVGFARREDMLAHMTFNSLFVSSQRVGDNAVIFTRRPRSLNEDKLALAHMICGCRDIALETDINALIDRRGGIDLPENIRALTNTLGNTLSPCSALSGKLRVPANSSSEMYFAIDILPVHEVQAFIERCGKLSYAERCLTLARSQAKAMLSFIGISPEKNALLSRASVFLAEPRYANMGNGASFTKRELWQLGISEDIPIICVFARERSQLLSAREMLKVHAYYAAHGILTDLVLVNDYGSDYEQPIRDAFSGMIALGGLSLNTRGGAWLIDGSRLTSEQRQALKTSAFICHDSLGGAWANIREKLKALALSRAFKYSDMPSGSYRLPSVKLHEYNGYGGFSENWTEYVIDIRADKYPPAAWANILASDSFGALVTERGGSFIWHENSRSGRLTPYVNDARNEGFGFMAYLADEKKLEYVRLLPGIAPATSYRAFHAEHKSRFMGGTNELCFSTHMFIDPDVNALRLLVEIENTKGEALDLRCVLFVDWLMGTDIADASFTREWGENGAIFARGAHSGTGYAVCTSAKAENCPRRLRFLGRGGIMRPDGLFCIENDGGCAIRVNISVEPRAKTSVEFAIGSSEDVGLAIEKLKSTDAASSLAKVKSIWENRRLRVETPVPALNAICNYFLPKQILASRILSRTGLYQPGGAYGFRDQLQDMLGILPIEPYRVREHILLAASRQFEAGDVMHWWHMPYLGVRTRISDDGLFLPYVCAVYVRETGDSSILDEVIPYLKNVDIPENEEDVYISAQCSDVSESLHKHCMRAIRNKYQTGRHGLMLMGAGDWNDGMNNVGARGEGESVWLTEFMCVCCEAYADICPIATDREWLMSAAKELKRAIEQTAWDGEWYLRAYTDDGEKLGGAECEECRIDAISQAWACFAGLDPKRVKACMDSAWALLVDKSLGIIKLLSPPFDDSPIYPGYIKGYPPGIRENSGQYTHAACWLALAYVKLNDSRAHECLNMLMPTNHADTKQKADVYKVEPYVMAADIYSNGEHAGMGGWTWYTGAAAWFLRLVLGVLGYERVGDSIRLNAMLGEWNACALTIRKGASVYKLICSNDADIVTLDGKPVDGSYIELIDDGHAHEAKFPPRR